MKKVLLLLTAVAAIALGCSKSDKSTSPSTAYANTATITGPDYGMTMCSGGYFIKVNGVTGPVRFTSVPSGSTIDLTTTSFPVNVKLNWHYATSPDPCGIIIVDAVTKAD